MIEIITQNDNLLEFINNIENKKSWNLDHLKVCSYINKIKVKMTEHNCATDHGYHSDTVSSSNDLFSEKIGTHISKNKLFYNSLLAFYEKGDNTKIKPTQIFTGSPKFWKRPTLIEKDISKAKNYIIHNNLSVYIHSIYLINLSKSNEEFMINSYDCLKYELDIGVKLGCKGVVVHTGKSLKLSVEEAIDNMYNNVITIYNNDCIDDKNPLLIETASGQGSETCWQIDSFKKFYNRFTDEQKNKIKICIDTCHVFAAGHDPIEYLIEWNNTFPNSIVLIHYNDSKEPLCSKKDRHAYPGEGYVGKEKMNKIAEWCLLHNLPMVIE